MNKLYAGYSHVYTKLMIILNKLTHVLITAQHPSPPKKKTKKNTSNDTFLTNYFIWGKIIEFILSHNIMLFFFNFGPSLKKREWWVLFSPFVLYVCSKEVAQVGSVCIDTQTNLLHHQQDLRDRLHLNEEVKQFQLRIWRTSLKEWHIRHILIF